MSTAEFASRGIGESPWSRNILGHMVGEFGATDALLRPRRERPRGRAAEQRDEVAPPHCPMPPVLPTERIAHLGTADFCIHPPGRNEMIAITPPKIFSKEVAQKQATPFTAPATSLTTKNRFTPNFRGWRLDEFSIFARPPPQGPLAHAGTRGIPSDGRCRAGAQAGPTGGSTHEARQQRHDGGLVL